MFNQPIFGFTYADKSRESRVNSITSYMSFCLKINSSGDELLISSSGDGIAMGSGVDELLISSSGDGLAMNSSREELLMDSNINGSMILFRINCLPHLYYFKFLGYCLLIMNLHPGLASMNLSYYSIIFVQRDGTNSR